MLLKKLFTEETFSQDRHDDPLYVIMFSATAVASTVEWIVDLLKKEQKLGGGELTVRTSTSDCRECIVKIDCDIWHLLEAAETLGIMKEDMNGKRMEFVLSNLDLFLKPGADMKNLLTTSEKQRIVLNEIMSLHKSQKTTVVGYPNIILYPGQSIVQVCRDNGIIKHIYPLHEHKELFELEKIWFSFPMTSQPLDEIRNYFGEAIGFYFAFLGLYTWSLIPPACVGLVQLFITLDKTCSYIFFAIMKMIWLTLFLEIWKRKSNELAFNWGTLRTVDVPTLHPTFRGQTLELDPVTKQLTPVSPSYKRHFKVYCVSTPIVCGCIFISIIVMLIYFEVENYAINEYSADDFLGCILVQAPGIFYTILVTVMSKMFYRVAGFLTEWENHKTQDSFENHRISKLLLFEFVNNFIAIGYIAFYLKDMDMLKWQICTMMIVSQLINQFQEAVYPLLVQKYSISQKKKDSRRETDHILNEKELWPYEGTYDDYLELFIQFGYVFLFSSVYPLAALLALLNNLVEIWADAFKLCKTYQRPLSRPVKGIGVWQIAFETLGILSVMSNCALICLSPIVQSHAAENSEFRWLLTAVLIEHIIIAAKVTMAYLISDVPKWVKVEIQKSNFESSQALKLKRKQRNKEKLEFLEKKKL